MTGASPPLRLNFRQVMTVPNFAFGAGTAVGLVSLLLASVVAARWMGPEDYSRYAAFAALLGMLIVGPAASIEQDVTRSVGHARGLDRRSLVGPLRAGTVICLVIAAVVFLPLGWQDNLLGGDAVALSAAVVLSAVIAMPAAVLRGMVAGGGLRGTFGVMVMIQGACTVGLPIILIMGWGMTPFQAFVVGSVVAFSAPIFVSGLLWRHIRSLVPKVRAVEGRFRVGTSLGILVVANVLLSINMTAIPAVLRTHVEMFGAVAIASAQILVSVSRVSTLIMAQVQPVVIGQMASGLPRGRQAGYVIGALVFGAVTVCGMAFVMPTVLEWIYGPEYDFTPGLALLSSVSVLALNPAYILMAIAIARHQYRLVAVAWGAGVAALILAAIMPTQSLPMVLALIAVAALIPCFLLSGALLPSRLEAAGSTG